MLHIHLAFVLKNGRLDLVNVLFIGNRNLDDFVCDYLILIVGLGHWRSRDDAVDELGHVYAFLEERFEDVVVGALA